MSRACVEVQGVSKRFQGRGDITIRALSDISFDVHSGEILGLVGESGSGKSTLGRTVLRLLKPDGGQIRFDNTDITDLNARQMQPFRRRMQMVFQDPYSSLDPRMTAGQIIGEALEIHKILPRRERPERVAELLTKVGLLPEHALRFPHEFSGGQRQRIGIARALAVEPSFLVADEPVSALDLSVQAQIVRLLESLHQQLRLTLLFISHDLAVVKQLCERVVVLYLGRIMEVAVTENLYSTPKHPYTEALLAAAPIPIPGAKRKRVELKTEIAPALDEQAGCVFRARCPHAIAECAKVTPELREIAPGHFKACIRDVL